MKKFSVIPTLLFIFFISMMLLSPSTGHLMSTALAFYAVMRYLKIRNDALCWSPYIFNHAKNKKFWIYHMAIVTPPFFITIFPFSLLPALLGFSLMLIGDLLKEARKDWLIY